MLKTKEPSASVHSNMVSALPQKTIRSEKKTGKNYFAALTGIRIIAAYMVFIHHYNFFTKGSFAWAFVNELHIGLPIFFVLSGFLIAYRYYSNGTIHVKNYIVNRVARVYPMYFLLTTLTFILAAFTFGSYHLYDLKIYLLKHYFLTWVFQRFKVYRYSTRVVAHHRRVFLLFSTVVFSFHPAQPGIPYGTATAMCCLWFGYGLLVACFFVGRLFQYHCLYV